MIQVGIVMGSKQRLKCSMPPGIAEFGVGANPGGLAAPHPRILLYNKICA